MAYLDAAAPPQRQYENTTTAEDGAVGGVAAYQATAAHEVAAPTEDEEEPPPRPLWSRQVEDARASSRPARVSAIATARASARAHKPIRASMRSTSANGGHAIVEECGPPHGASVAVAAETTPEDNVDDAVFTDEDLKAVEDCIFLLRSRPSHEITYNILAEVGIAGSTWRSVFLLLDGLGALAQPLLRCALGGIAGPMRGAPPGEDLALMAEILQEVRGLLTSPFLASHVAPLPFSLLSCLGPSADGHERSSGALADGRARDGVPNQLARRPRQASYERQRQNHPPT